MIYQTLQRNRKLFSFLQVLSLWNIPVKKCLVMYSFFPPAFTEINILLLSLGARGYHDLAQEDIFSFVCFEYVCNVAHLEW